LVGGSRNDLLERIALAFVEGVPERCPVVCFYSISFFIVFFFKNNLKVLWWKIEEKLFWIFLSRIF